MSLRDQIAAAHDLTDETIVIPEWGNAEIVIKSMSLRERARLFEKTRGADEELSIAEFYPYVIVMCSYDPETNPRAFTEADVDMLQDKSAAVLERIATAALRISGLGVDAEKQQGNAF